VPIIERKIEIKKYCEDTIKGVCNEEELNKFNFCLEKGHSLICIKD